MRVETVLTGYTALVMHSDKLADPDNEFSKAIAKITGKLKKTEDDRIEIARLEHAGGLYIDADGPFVPAANVRRSFVEAAKIRRLGTAVERAVSLVNQKSYLEYPGPRTASGLFDDKRFVYTVSVGISGKRVMRTRPQFQTWKATVEWELFPSVLSLEDFTAITEMAGSAVGLGDNRRNGFGRFQCEVTEV